MCHQGSNFFFFSLIAVASRSENVSPLFDLFLNERCNDAGSIERIAGRKCEIVKHAAKYDRSVKILSNLGFTATRTLRPLLTFLPQ